MLLLAATVTVGIPLKYLFCILENLSGTVCMACSAQVKILSVK